MIHIHKKIKFCHSLTKKYNIQHKTMKAITHISRIIVGFLFIISGLIKLNDPVGFSFKLDEYFSEAVFNLTFLQPFALSFAVFLVIAEVVLGVLLLIGFKKKFTLWSLFLMILFFTFLTFYSAYFNKVTDCGCFGDALKLKPWESFIKDVVLLVLIVILMIGQKFIQPLTRSETANYVIVLLTLLTCGGIAYYVLNHLPIIDFRAYKVGVNIQKGMEIPEDAPRPEYDIIFTYKVNGENKTYGMNDLANLPADAEFVSRDEKLLKAGFEPPIHDFTIERDGANYADEYLEEPKLLMFVMYDLQKSSGNGLKKLQPLAEQAAAKGYKVIAMTASPIEVIDRVQNQYNYTFDFYFCDATTLKTIERANPSIVVLEYGTIVQKKHYNDAEAVKLQ